MIINKEDQVFKIVRKDIRKVLFFFFGVIVDDDLSLYTPFSH